MFSHADFAYLMSKEAIEAKLKVLADDVPGGDKPVSDEKDAVPDLPMPLDMPPPMVAPGPGGTVDLAPEGKFPVGAKVREVFSGAEGVVAMPDPPQSHFKDITFVQFGGDAPVRVRTDQLEAIAPENLAPTIDTNTVVPAFTGPEGQPEGEPKGIGASKKKPSIKAEASWDHEPDEDEVREALEEEGISFRSERRGEKYPSVNVKVHRYSNGKACQAIFDEHDVPKELRDEIFGDTFQMVQEGWWYDAGSGGTWLTDGTGPIEGWLESGVADVFSSGRSGGHLILKVSLMNFVTEDGEDKYKLDEEAVNGLKTYFEHIKNSVKPENVDESVAGQIEVDLEHGQLSGKALAWWDEREEKAENAPGSKENMRALEKEGQQKLSLESRKLSNGRVVLMAAKPKKEDPKTPEGQPSRLKMWKRADNYGGTDYDGYYEICGKHRDSDALERANFDSILKALGGEHSSPEWEKTHTEEVEEGKEEVMVAHSGHWAVGWVEVILVHKDSSEVGEAEAIVSELEDYPVYDEDLWGDYESEEQSEMWTSSGKSKALNALDKAGLFEEATSFDELPEGLRSAIEEEYFEKMSCNGDNWAGDLDEWVPELAKKFAEKEEREKGTKEQKEAESAGQQELPGLERKEKMKAALKKRGKLLAAKVKANKVHARTPEPDTCEHCGEGWELTWMQVEVDGKPEEGWVCDCCGQYQEGDKGKVEASKKVEDFSTFQTRIRAEGKKAQEFISKEIGHLIKDKKYPQDRAEGAAYAVARKKGYKVPKKKMSASLKASLEVGKTYVEHTDYDDGEITYTLMDMGLGKDMAKKYPKAWEHAKKDMSNDQWGGFLAMEDVCVVAMNEDEEDPMLVSGAFLSMDCTLEAAKKVEVAPAFITAKEDDRNITYEAFLTEVKALKTKDHASALGIIGYIPEGWDDIQAKLAKDGVTLESPKAEFDVKAMLEKGLTQDEVSYALASLGVPSATITAAIKADDASTPPAPTEDPGAGKVWVWDAAKKTFYAADKNTGGAPTGDSTH